MLKEVKTGKILLGAVFKGDTDSACAMYIAATFGWNIACIINIQKANETTIIQHQALAMAIPVITEQSSGEEVADLYEAMKKAKEQYKITGIIAADSYKSISKICKELQLRMFAPLWQKDKTKLLREMIECGMEMQITNVTAECLGKEWLGRIIDMNAYHELVQLQYRLGINPAGESKEYQSVVLYCPHLFQKRLTITKAEKVMESEYKGIYAVQDVALIG